MLSFQNVRKGLLINYKQKAKKYYQQEKHSFKYIVNLLFNKFFFCVLKENLKEIKPTLVCIYVIYIVLYVCFQPGLFYGESYIFTFYENRFQYNRWQRRVCTLSVHLYSDVTSVNSVFVSDKIVNNSDNFRIKCLSYSNISAILRVLYFPFFTLFI